MLACSEVWKIVAQFPCLSRVWDRNYVYRDCRDGFKQPWLNYLAEDPDNEVVGELAKLNGYLGIIEAYPDFHKLYSGLRARNDEVFVSAVSEVKTAVWLNCTGILTEIHPQLQCGGESDLLVNVANHYVYVEVYEPRDLPSTQIGEGIIPIFLTDQRTEAPKRANILGRKGSRQLPSGVMGMWVSHIYHHPLERSWADFFKADMGHRQNVLGVALWVRSGSKRMPSQCVPCRQLEGDDHDIYWLDNASCENITLQRKLLCHLID